MKIVVKVICIKNPDEIQRYLENCKLYKNINHPLVNKLYDLKLIGNELYVVEEYADKGDFRAYINSLEEPLLENKIVDYFCMMALAVHKLH